VEITTLAEQFITQGRYLRDWSPKTIRTYQQALAMLSAAGVGELSRASLQAFVVWMQKRGLTAGGINVRLRTINSFLSWLHEEGTLAQPLRVKLLPKRPRALTTFSDADIKRILTVRPVGRSQTRTWVLLVCLLDTGVRIEEALSLERGKVNLDALTMTVHGKGSRERVVPISQDGRKALFKLVTQQTSRYVFATASGARLSYRNAYRDIKRLCQRAGVEGAHVHPHNVRHYFAVSYIRAGGDIYRLSRILGHTSLSTIQVYLRSMGLEHLQEGHARYSPLGRGLI
jgi:integrase/recombinase XerD